MAAEDMASKKSGRRRRGRRRNRSYASGSNALILLSLHLWTGQASQEASNPIGLTLDEQATPLRKRNRQISQASSSSLSSLPPEAYWSRNGGDEIPNLSVKYPGSHPHERYLQQRQNNADDVSKYGVRPIYINNNNNNGNDEEEEAATFLASERGDDTTMPPESFAFTRFDDDFMREFLPYDQESNTGLVYNNDNRDNIREEFSVDYQPLRIRFITSPLEARRGESDAVDDQIDEILSTALPKAASMWSSHLSVYPVAGNITIPHHVCYGTFSEDLSLSAAELLYCDLVVIVSGYNTLRTPSGSSTPVCGPGSLALGAACALDQWDRPIIGFVNFCLQEDDDDDMEALDRLVSEAFQEAQRFRRQNITTGDDITKVDFETIMTHELGHVLGFDSYLFKFFRNATTGEPLTPRPFETTTVQCSNGAEPSEQEGFPSDRVVQQGRTAHGDLFFDIVTPRVAQVARNHFNCPALAGARLENYESSCLGSHWDERLFLTEILSPALSWRNNVLSPLTLALMEDTGWYQVNNYHNATIPSFGLGAGCEFVTGDCIVDDRVPPYGKDYFCDHAIRLSTSEGMLKMEQESLNKITCDPTHQYWALCDLWDASTIPSFLNARFPLSKSAYFSDDSLLVSFPQADFCPMAMKSLGVDCTQDLANVDGHYLLSRQYTYHGEQKGPSSRCINAFSDISADQNRRMDRPACMHVECDDELRKVIMGLGEYRQLCEYDGQVLQIPGSTADYLECPRLSTICPHLFCPGSCSGRGVCDYDAFPHPKCKCFDPDNTSEGCYPNPAETTSTTNAETKGPADTTPFPDDFIPAGEQNVLSSSRQRTPLCPVFVVSYWFHVLFSSL